MKFTLKKPCKDCPFVKGTTMVLEPGRMQGIVDHLHNDYNVFPCHKTTQHDEDEEGEPITVAHDNEQACAGALAYMYQHYEQLPVMARIAIRFKELKIETVKANAKTLEEPGKWPTN